jgi:hypothetical protein
MATKNSEGKDTAAVSLGRRGGRARAERLSAEELSAIGKAAAEKRWGRKLKDKRGFKKKER